MTDGGIGRRQAAGAMLASSLLPGLARAAAPKDAGRCNALVLTFNYLGTGLYLPSVTQDGKLIAETMRKAHFAAVTQLANTDREGLDAGLQKFVGAFRPDSIAILWLAGHGAQIDGENYVLLDDGTTFVSLMSIVEFVRSRCRSSIFFLDACRNDPFQGKPAATPAGMPARALKIERLGFAGGATRSLDMAEKSGYAFKAVSTDAVNRLGAFQIQGTGVKIVFATDPQNVAADSVSKTDVNSPFARAISERLAEQRSLDDVIAMATGDVVKATGGEQSPWSQGSLGQPIFIEGPPPNKNPGRVPFQVIG